MRNIWKSKNYTEITESELWHCIMVGTIIQFLQSREYLLTANCRALLLSTSTEYSAYDIEYWLANTLSYCVTLPMLLSLGIFEHAEILKHVFQDGCLLPGTWKYLKVCLNYAYLSVCIRCRAHLT